MNRQCRCGSVNMPQPAEHIAQAEKNERLYDNLIGTEFNDWAVVGLFYAALHYVDAYFVQRFGASPSNHNARNRLVSMTIELAAIRTRYRELYARSLDARYEIVAMSEDEVRQERTAHFVPVRTHIRALLSLT